MSHRPILEDWVVEIYWEVVKVDYGGLSCQREYIGEKNISSCSNASV